MDSSGFFRIKPIAKLILKREILGSHTISDQSLLLSTIVLNDKTIGALTSLFTPCMECCGDVSCLHIPIDREESNVRKDKRITTAQ